MEILRSGITVARFSDEALGHLRDILKLSEQASTLARQHYFLEKLRFDLMNERFEDIEEAHKETFKWILEDMFNFTAETEMPNPCFARWLEAGSGIFHITGKPGSGKSTLMKYICKHSKTRSLLEAWAGERKLVVGKFFFWRLGTTMQKSLKGLARALLYHIMCERPEMISSLFHEAWEKTALISNNTTLDIELTHTEIFGALRKIATQLDDYRDFKICFFIDGLDEFEGQHEYIVQQFLEWTNLNSHVKICVSSREWNIFQYRFPADTRLKIHYLTRNDIEKYVLDRLGLDDRFLGLKATSEARSDLIYSVVKKAEGVFFWVTLVVNALKEGLSNRDSIADLKRKVDSLPPELNALFRHLLLSTHSADRRQSALTFAMVLAVKKADGDLSLLEYSFLGDYEIDPKFAMSAPLEHKDWCDAEISDRLDYAKIRLTALGKGLLESRPSRRRLSIVLFHQTVQEFLESEETQKILEEQLRGRDCIEAICQLFLARVKFIPFGKKPTLPQEIERAVELIPWGDTIRVLRLISSTSDRPKYFEFLDSLHNALLSRQFNLYSMSEDVRQLVLRGHFNNIQLQQCSSKSNTLIYSLFHSAASHGLEDYVMWRVNKHKYLKEDHREAALLLQSVIEGMASGGIDKDSKLLRSLLQSGISTNVPSRSWYALLEAYPVDWRHSWDPRHSSLERLSLWHGIMIELLNLANPFNSVSYKRSRWLPIREIVATLLPYISQPSFKISASTMRIPRELKQEGLPVPIDLQYDEAQSKEADSIYTKEVEDETEMKTEDELEEHGLCMEYGQLYEHKIFFENWRFRRWIKLKGGQLSLQDIMESLQHPSWDDYIHTLESKSKVESDNPPAKSSEVPDGIIATGAPGELVAALTRIESRQSPDITGSSSEISTENCRSSEANSINAANSDQKSVEALKMTCWIQSVIYFGVNILTTQVNLRMIGKAQSRKTPPSNNQLNLAQTYS
jgi:hypothetical protein